MVPGVTFMDAAADLLLDGVCPGCGEPGRGVCPGCRAAVMAGRIGPRQRLGLDLPLWSAGDYLGPVRRLVSQAKDHHRWDALALLGVRLAQAVAGLADATGIAGPGILVPFPSTPASVRRRGLDVMMAMARLSARQLRRVGLEASVHHLLVHRRRVDDQGDLSGPQRWRNMAGCLVARHPLPSWAGPGPGWIILVDDLVTTGASLCEGVRALTEAGHRPVGTATVAATVPRK